MGFKATKTGLLVLILGFFTSALPQAYSRDLPFAQSWTELDESLLEDAPEELNLYNKSDLDRYFFIQQVTVTEVEPEPIVESYVFEKNDKFDLGSIIMVVDQLIALGERIWPIIEAGRPVVTTGFSPAISVLPQTDESPDYVALYLMDSWSAPKQRSYLVEYKNGFGSAVISFTYNVSFQHDGTLEGVGRYLTGLNVSASRIQVKWGFNFNATSSLVNISNRGPRADPIAAATIKIDYQAKSFMSEIQSSEAFHITGTGELTQVY
jgi:hypothetical protein